MFSKNSSNETLKYFTTFISNVALAFIVTIFLLLPWTFRVLSILVWLFSALMALQTIQAIYSPFSSAIPLFTLQFAAILLMVAWVTLVLKEGKQIWGALLAGGLVVWILAMGAEWLSTHWTYANLFFGVLPAALLVTGMFYITLRGRRIRQSKNNRQGQGVPAEINPSR